MAGVHDDLESPCEEEVHRRDHRSRLRADGREGGCSDFV